MKKSLLAVAAMTAFAGAAQAQSSVTVYGILDVGFSGTNTKAAATGKQTETAKFADSAETSSRIGFKGVEDLGGGTSAFFTAEFQAYPTEQNLSGDKNNGLFNRQTFVGLEKKGLGKAAIGTQYTPIHMAVAATDPGQTNNVIGSVIYPASGNNGITTAGYTVRQNNALTLNSDSFSGFKFNAMLVQNGSNTDQTTTATATTGGMTNTTGWGIGADYAFKKLYVTANYQAFKQVTTSSGSVTLPSTPTLNSLADINGVNVQDNQAYIAATYDFGILKAYAAWQNRKATSTLTSNNYLKRSAEQIGVRSFITPKVEAWASAGLGRYQAYGASQPTTNFTAYQLGSNYWLSKRTNLYGIFGSSQTSSQTTGYPASGNQYAVGVRHTF